MNYPNCPYFCPKCRKIEELEHKIICNECIYPRILDADQMCVCPEGFKDGEYGDNQCYRIPEEIEIEELKIYYSFDNGVNDISLNGRPKSSVVEKVSYCDDIFNIDNRAIDFS